MRIKEILKGNKYVYSVIVHIRKLQLVYLPHLITITKFNFSRLLRVIRLNKSSSYERLRYLKNKHKGEKCFIVATGPSLTIEDLEKLQNEITFSMNSICFAFDET